MSGKGLGGKSLGGKGRGSLTRGGLARVGILRLVILDRELGRPSFVDAFDSLAHLVRALLLGGCFVVRLIALDDRTDEREGGQSLQQARRNGADDLADPRRQIVQSIEQPLGQLAEASANGGAAQDAR